MTTSEASRLTLVARIAGTRPARAVYRCECGTEREFFMGPVRRGKSRSCGCLAREMAVEKMRRHKEAFSGGNVVHGRYGSPAHRSWASMIQRCTNPKRSNYAYYGGRGITVCEAWKTFDGFYADMGDRPEGTTLERKENDKGYEPGNCCWATVKEQSNNRRPRGTALAASG